MAEFDRQARTFVRGEGNYLYDARGKCVFDAVSSIWTTIHGHSHPHIVERIARQAQRLDHATLLGATNDVAEELALRLCALAGLDQVCFSSDGASAVELALKICIQFWQNSGEPQRSRFVRLVDGYHGDTAGAMSVSDIALFKERFGALTFESVSYDASEGILNQPDVAAIIVEPLVQAAAGMRVVAPSVYQGLARRRTLLIVDEIATGFGRTGTMFAFEQLGLRPDLVCLGKGLTGGTLALSATLATQNVYDAFLGSYAESKQLFHGHSYAGNPIACAAALASLEVFESENTLVRTAQTGAHIALELQALREHRAVRVVRGAGMMHGIEIDPDLVSKGRAPTAAWRIAQSLYERGHFTRPIGNVVQFVPPLSTSLDEASAFVTALRETLE